MYAVTVFILTICEIGFNAASPRLIAEIRATRTARRYTTG
jgi:hypothetical protein